MSGFLLFERMTKVLEYGYIALRQFPRAEKYKLAADLKEQMFRIIRLIIRANKARERERRLELIEELDVDLELLRVQIELAKDLQLLPFKKYGIWITKVDEVGRLIGGWLKSI